MLVPTSERPIKAADRRRCITQKDFRRSTGVGSVSDILRPGTLKMWFQMDIARISGGWARSSALTNSFVVNFQFNVQPFLLFQHGSAVVLLNLPHLAAFCHSQRFLTWTCSASKLCWIFQTNKKGSPGSCRANYLNIKMALCVGLRQLHLPTHRFKSTNRLICWDWTLLPRCTQFFAAKFQFLIPLQEPTPSVDWTGHWN